MNERIQELAEHAKEYARGFNYQHEVFEKKFAELIIKECADICYNRDYAYGSAYGEQIEKHFGVEL